MLTRLDAMALALLWTEQAARKPAPTDAPVPRAGTLPEGLRLADVLSLEQALGGADDAEAGEHAPPDPATSSPPSPAVAAVAALAASLRARARAALESARRAGLGVVTIGDAEYPKLLAQIPDPPPAFWVAGELPRTMAAVGVVGSRNATPHGLQVAFRLGEDLARAGICVVSGLARGVDGAAHRGALQSGGPTIAVLGCGVDVDYPPEHAALARDIARHGAVVVDRSYFDRLGISSVGATAEIRGRRVKVVALTDGIRSFTTTPYVFVDLKYARQYTGTFPERASSMVVRVSLGPTVILPL